MEKILKRIFLGKPLLMNVYEDKFGNRYGGIIHEDDGKLYVNVTSHIDSPVYLGIIEIYI
jgi:hypothetical protein